MYEYIFRAFFSPSISLSWRRRSTHVCVFLFSPGDVVVHVMFDLGLIALWFYFATGE